MEIQGVDTTPVMRMIVIHGMEDQKGVARVSPIVSEVVLPLSVLEELLMRIVTYDKINMTLEEGTTVDEETDTLMTMTKTIDDQAEI